MTRAPPLSGRRHIFVTFAAAVSLWRFSVCAFVGLRIEGSMNACMELVGFSTSNKVKNHCPSHIFSMHRCKVLTLVWEGFFIKTEIKVMHTYCEVLTLVWEGFLIKTEIKVMHTYWKYLL